MRWNDWFGATFDNPIKEFLSGIATVGNKMFKCKPIHQFNSLCDIVPVARRQPQPQRIAKTINCDVDFGAKSTSATPQRLVGLTTVFFVRLQRKDEHEQSCYQSSRFPYPGHPRSAKASVPIHLYRTSGQIACKWYSISRNRRAIAAIAPRFYLPKARLQQIVGNLLHSCRRKHADHFSKIPGFSPIVRLGVSYLP
jgi:hypothetical protein